MPQKPLSDVPKTIHNHPHYIIMSQRCNASLSCSASEGGYCNATHHCICHESYAGENCEIGKFLAALR